MNKFKIYKDGVYKGTMSAESEQQVRDSMHAHYGVEQDALLYIAIDDTLTAPDGQISGVELLVDPEGNTIANLISDLNITFRTPTNEDILVVGKTAIIYDGRVLTEDMQIVASMRSFLRNAMRPAAMPNVVKMLAQQVMADNAFTAEQAVSVASQLEAKILSMGFRPSLDYSASGMVLSTLNGLKPVEMFDGVFLKEQVRTLTDVAQSSYFIVCVRHAKDKDRYELLDYVNYNPDAVNIDDYHRSTALVNAHMLANAYGSVIMAAMPELSREHVMGDIPLIPIA